MLESRFALRIRSSLKPLQLHIKHSTFCCRRVHMIRIQNNVNIQRRTLSVYTLPRASSIKYLSDVTLLDSYKDPIPFALEFDFRKFDSSRSIVVNGLSKFTTEGSLYAYFCRFGTITGFKLIREKVTRKSLRYGFVEFASPEQAESAAEHVLHVIDGREVHIRMNISTNLEEQHRLFIGRLLKETSVTTLRQHFSKFGKIYSCHIPRTDNNLSRGFGYVVYYSQESIDRALNAAPHCIDDIEVHVRRTERYSKKLTLYIGELSERTNNESLEKFYARYGRLTRCEVKKDHETGESRKFGFVTFVSQEDLNRALASQPHIIDGEEVELTYATHELDLFVTCLSPDTTEDTLFRFFSRYGDVRTVTMIENDSGSISAFVAFSSVKEIERVLADRPHKIEGKLIHSCRKHDNYSIVVTGLPKNWTDNLLYKMFSKFGKPVHWEVKRDLTTDEPFGCGHVSFESANEVTRALHAHTNCPNSINGKVVSVFRTNEDSCIFVGRLPKHLSDTELFDTFVKFGKIVKCEVLRDPKSNEPLGYGYVSFATAEDALEALHSGPHFIDGNEKSAEIKQIPF
ncbi:RNA recognition motif domain-containing protein [Ditylenchus destructor]|nr:RNA recognition motif domain-containing protein [Ditylenchus destructor]